MSGNLFSWQHRKQQEAIIMETQLCYQSTKYPKIFKNVYWGHFSNSDSFAGGCCLNRDPLVNEYNIIKYLGGSRSLSVHLDHQEYYLCEDGTTLLIYSPYHNTQELLDFNHRHRFEKIAPMYRHDISTFLKRFSGLKAMRAWVKACRKDTGV